MEYGPMSDVSIWGIYPSSPRTCMEYLRTYFTCCHEYEHLMHFGHPVWSLTAWAETKHINT